MQFLVFTSISLIYFPILSFHPYAGLPSALLPCLWQCVVSSSSPSAVIILQPLLPFRFSSYPNCSRCWAGPGSPTDPISALRSQNSVHEEMKCKLKAGHESSSHGSNSPRIKMWHLNQNCAGPQSPGAWERLPFSQT
jgi:hypothetical protein